MDKQTKAAGPGRGEAAYDTTLNSNYSPIDHLLSKLEAKRTGQGTYIARCPGPVHEHGDRHPSLAVRETEDGKILLFCRAGCDTHDVVAAIGLSLADLFPPKPADPAQVGRPERRPFPAADILRCIAFEAVIVGVAGCDIVAGKAPTAEEKERLILAVGRIQNALAAAGIDHD